MTADLQPLLDRLARAEGPDRELDADILDLIEPGAWLSADRRQWGSSCGWKLVPAYTASLDAALPGEDDGFWEISGPMLDTKRWRAAFTTKGRRHVVWASTEPLARRIAALQARQAGSDVKETGDVR